MISVVVGKGVTPLSPKLTGTLFFYPPGCSPKILNPCSPPLFPPCLPFFSPPIFERFVLFIEKFCLLLFQKWTKWVPILTKLGEHHGLVLPQLSTKFQLLLSLRSRAVLISLTIFERFVLFIEKFCLLLFQKWTKWVPILTKLGEHHGLVLPQLSTKFQLLLSLPSCAIFISFLFFMLQNQYL